MIVTASLAFELRGRIGATEGRNSEVHRAFDPQLEAEVVVKRVPKARFVDTSEYYAEARKLYEARHPNVVDVRYACEDADHVFLAMPLYEGGSLHSIAAATRLTNRDVVRFGLDMLQGLHHVHSRRLVHFDVKPSNVLVDGSGKAALADFGISKFLRPDGLAEVDRLYFLHWPPEFMAARELSQAADIYQAGLTLYRLLVGIESLEEQARGLQEVEIQHGIERGTFPDRLAFPLHIPMALARVVKTALEVNPNDRYGTVLDMTADLAAVNQHLDWLYAPTAANEQSWELAAGGQLAKIELTQAAGGWEVVTTKTNTTTGAIRRQNALSANGLAWGEARTLVKKALRDLE